MINKQRKSIYPEYEHIQLLKACILEGESAIEAWRNWDRVTDINDIDNASMRLLPSLYLTLRENNIHPDYIDKIKGVYRRTLVKNKILLPGGGGSSHYCPLYERSCAAPFFNHPLPNKPSEGEL